MSRIQNKNKCFFSSLQVNNFNSSFPIVIFYVFQYSKIHTVRFSQEYSFEQFIFTFKFEFYYCDFYIFLIWKYTLWKFVGIFFRTIYNFTLLIWDFLSWHFNLKILLQLFILFLFENTYCENFWSISFRTI